MSKANAIPLLYHTKRKQERKRAPTKSKRFISLAILNIHKDLTDKLDLKDIGNEFVSAREGRLEYFGKFV